MSRANTAAPNVPFFTPMRKCKVGSTESTTSYLIPRLLSFLGLATESKPQAPSLMLLCTKHH